MRYGFTLTEVVAALFVFELGLLGVAALALQAHGLLADASLRSRAVAAAQEVADSLSVSGAGGEGGRAFAGGSVSWTVGGASGGGRGRRALREVSIRATEPGGDRIFSVRVVVPEAGPSGAP
ncbi:MAG: hypothetical protein ACLFWG_07800 [Longimicrobiales bacterium]